MDWGVFSVLATVVDSVISAFYLFVFGFGKKADSKEIEVRVTPEHQFVNSGNGTQHIYLGAQNPAGVDSVPHDSKEVERLKKEKEELASREKRASLLVSQQDQDICSLKQKIASLQSERSTAFKEIKSLLSEREEHKCNSTTSYDKHMVSCLPHGAFRNEEDYIEMTAYSFFYYLHGEEGEQERKKLEALDGKRWCFDLYLQGAQENDLLFGFDKDDRCLKAHFNVLQKDRTIQDQYGLTHPCLGKNAQIPVRVVLKMNAVFDERTSVIDPGSPRVLAGGKLDVMQFLKMEPNDEKAND